MGEIESNRGNHTVPLKRYLKEKNKIFIEIVKCGPTTLRGVLVHEFRNMVNPSLSKGNRFEFINWNAFGGGVTSDVGEVQRSPRQDVSKRTQSYNSRHW